MTTNLEHTKNLDSILNIVINA